MTNPNDFAFPPYCNDPKNCGLEHLHGLTKREYFAAMAMQAILNAQNHLYLYANGDVQEKHSPEACAKAAIYAADALIAELSKESK